MMFLKKFKTGLDKFYVLNIHFSPFSPSEEVLETV